MSIYRGATILLTGACGTVGMELLSQLSLQNPRRIIALDNNENAVFHSAAAWQHKKSIEFVLGDVRDLDRLDRVSRGVDIILHTAAYKHVALCESSPADAVSNNIIGVKNVIEAAFRNKVRRVLFTSSDKAVNPTTVMGATKLIGEQLMRAASASVDDARGDGIPIFASIRLGNILGSSGSVVPVFLKQIAAGGPITLTDPRMTRFVMTISDAGRSVLQSLSIAKGGEVFTTKMSALAVKDLAEALRDQCDGRHIEIKVIGARQGEKLHEDLFNADECRRIADHENYLVIQPDVARFTSRQNGKLHEGIGKVVANYRNSCDTTLLTKTDIIHLLQQLPPVMKVK
jgi:FlaA1/EpsC-like NDP-sugar epimerase